MSVSSWETKALENVTTFQRGFDITKASQNKGPYPVVSSSGVHSTHNQYKVKGPGIVIGRKGSLGTVFYIKQDFWPHDTTLWVKDFHGNDRRFCYFFLKTMGFERFDVGASNPTLNRNHIHELRVRVPSLSTQQRIAAILSAYDNLIENNTRRIAILEEMARRLYEEWFIHFRFPGHEGVKMVESKIGLVPEGWVWSSLESISKLISRGITPKYNDDADCRIINQKCIRDQRLSMEPARRQSKKVPEDKLVEVGDVLINSTGVGTLGRVAQVYEPLGNCTVDSHVTIVRPNDEIDQDFFGLALLNLQPRFESLGVGATGQTELSRARVAESACVVPPESIQKQFGDVARPMRSLAVKLATKNANLRIQRDLLLPKLISGEIDVFGNDQPSVEVAAE